MLGERKGKKRQVVRAIEHYSLERMETFLMRTMESSTPKNHLLKLKALLPKQQQVDFMHLLLLL